MLWTHPYQIARASGGQYDPCGEELQTGYACARVYGIQRYKTISMVASMGMSLPLSLDSFFSNIFSLSFSPPHLPDVREVWEEPGGVCVLQSPSFLLNCRETPHVLKTPAHTNRP